MQDSVKCMLHMRSEVKLDMFVNSVLFRFTMGLVLRIPFCEEPLDLLHAVSAVSGSRA